MTTHTDTPVHFANFNWDKFVKENSQFLYYFILKRTSFIEDIPDIIQQTLLESFANRSKFNGQSKPETWIYGIAHNLTLNFYRRRIKYRNEINDTDLLENHIDGDNFAESLSLQDELEKIFVYIETLPDTHKDVFNMIINKSYSYEDAADELSIPVGTIRSRLFSIRQRLKLLTNT